MIFDLFRLCCARMLNNEGLVQGQSSILAQTVTMRLHVKDMSLVSEMTTPTPGNRESLWPENPYKNNDDHPRNSMLYTNKEGVGHGETGGNGGLWRGAQARSAERCLQSN